MSSKSNNQGRAYEFSYLLTLFDEISKFRAVDINKNSSYFVAKSAWETLSNNEKKLYRTSALAGVLAIFEFEPIMLEASEGEMQLEIQADRSGEIGDVRDILIKRRDIEWEIGLSVKRNNFAVKHSRLSSVLDFGEKWYGVKCTEKYWDEIKPIFDYLNENKGVKWQDIPSKEDDVYVPLLNAFKNELERQRIVKGNVLAKSIVEYMLGKFDFYKMIGLDGKRETRNQVFNFRGTLNKDGKLKKRLGILNLSKLPKRIVALQYKPKSKTTLELYLDEGWQFSFRIHNASKKVENSLKFDINIIGMPSTIDLINCSWNI